MKRIILQENFIAIVGLTTVVLLIIASGVWSGLETLKGSPEYANAATSSSVTVSATVAGTISCSSDNSSTAFGTILTSAVSTSTPNVSSTMSCANAAAGCAFYVNDAGGNSTAGLFNSTSTGYVITSASSTLVAGTEGYGINATTTSVGSGATLALTAQFSLKNDTSTSTVGGLTLTSIKFANATATSSNREVVIRHKASISTLTWAGTYADTITYQCLAN